MSLVLAPWAVDNPIAHVGLVNACLGAAVYCSCNPNAAVIVDTKSSSLPGT